MSDRTWWVSVSCSFFRARETRDLFRVAKWHFPSLEVIETGGLLQREFSAKGSEQAIRWIEANVRDEIRA